MTDLKSNNEFDSLESFFHEKLKDASFARAAGPWEQIEAELVRMEKEKRRRRFFWFFTSGIVLLGGLAALWFFVLDEKFQTKDTIHKKQADLSPSTKEIPSATMPSAEETNTTANENTVEQNIATSENTQVAANARQPEQKNEGVSSGNQKELTSTARIKPVKSSPGIAKIQLAATMKKANPAVFKKLPFAVVEVEGKDGIIRYFAEAEVSDVALQTIRNSGFASAFVKKNFDAGDPVIVVKMAPEISSSAIAGTTTHEQFSTKQNKNVATESQAKQNSADTKGEPLPTNITTKEDVTQTKEKHDQVSEANPVQVANNNNINNMGGVKNENNNVPPIENTNSLTANPAVTGTVSPTSENRSTLQITQETKEDSIPIVAATETKKDSIQKRPKAADSSKTAAAEVAPTPFTPEWALLLLAGPNIFTSQAQSNLYPTSGESQPTSLNTELKVQFRPIKLLSLSGGVNYTTYSVKQDRTFFRFDKKQTSDYIFYSAFGPMAAPMSTLLEGYSVQAPFDTFPCYYSQSSKLNMINIPLEANLHFIKKSRIGAFIGLGANSSFALSQHSTLTLHKEHFDNNISYTNVTVDPFSLSLLFSLGCDVRVGKKLYLSFVPSYRYGVTNLSKTSGTTFSPSYFSGNAGLKFKF